MVDYHTCEDCIHNGCKDYGYGRYEEHTDWCYLTDEECYGGGCENYDDGFPDDDQEEEKEL